MDLTPVRGQFDDDGYVRLPAAFPEASAATMADAIWSELARRHGLRRDDPSTWTVPQPGGLGPLREAGAFGQLATTEVVAAITGLVGTDDWPRPHATSPRFMLTGQAVRFVP